MTRHVQAQPVAAKKPRFKARYVGNCDLEYAIDRQPPVRLLQGGSRIRYVFEAVDHRDEIKLVD
jgi:hypothetical protein